MEGMTLYLKLPPFLQNAAVTLEGWRIARRRFGGAYEQAAAEYWGRREMPGEAIRAWRDKRLALFVRRAAAEVPFWAARFRAAGVDPASIRGLDDLARLPVLGKDEVRELPEPLKNRAALAREPFLVSYTSGTTGAGWQFPVTWSAHREQWAVWWRYRRWHRLSRAEWCAYLGGRSVVPLEHQRPPFWRVNRPGRQVLFSGYHLGPETARDYLREIARLKIRWIHGYPSLVAFLASCKCELGIGCPEVRWVTVSAENLLPHQSRIIEQAFGVRPRQHYGMAEGAANISECPADALHVDEDFAGVEFLPQADGRFRIVGTNFTNEAFPLIRYEVGDIADYAETDRCPCGRPGRVIRSIDGRQEDYVITRNGARLGRLDHIFKDMAHVREAQIRQERAGVVEVRVAKDDRYGEADERRLRHEIEKRTGGEVEYTIRYVNRVERTAAGKVRFVVSGIKEGQIKFAEKENKPV